MSTMSAIGTNASVMGQSGSSYWTHSNDVLFFGEISKITGGRLYNQKAGATDYLTVGGSAGSYTFQCPNTAPYIAADTDYIWFKTDETPRTTTEAELVGYDLQRTPIKYDDASPNSIRWIAILKPTTNLLTILDKLFQSFQLPIEWHNDTNAFGHIKSNRIGQNLWTPESVVPEMLYTNTGGTGDRSAIITVTKPAALINTEGTTIHPALIDGHLFGDYASLFYPDGQAIDSTKWINFDFGAGARKFINETKWHFNPSNYTAGVWKWQGSNEESATPDAGNFVDISSSFNIQTVVGAGITTDTSLSANVTGYRHYRLLGVSGAINANITIWWETEFKIGSL